MMIPAPRARIAPGEGGGDHIYIYICVCVTILLRSYEFKILSLSNQDFLVHVTCRLAVATAQISLVDLAE